MTDNMGRGILAPRSNSQIQDGAREMRTLGRTTAAAISDLDRQVNGRVGQVENLSGVNRNDIAAWRQATAEIQNKIDDIEQNLEPGEDGKDGDPGPPGPGGSISLEETDPGCFVDSEITWMQWPESGGLPAVWNPNTQSYENPIRVDASVGTRVYVGDTMIHGDTGWRDITYTLLEGMTANSILVKRTGHNVEIIVSALEGHATTGLTRVFNLPQGFRPRSSGAFPARDAVYMEASASSGGMFIRTSESRVSTYGIFSVQSAWPTTLPGTPA